MLSKENSPIIWQRIVIASEIITVDSSVVVEKVQASIAQKLWNEGIRSDADIGLLRYLTVGHLNYDDLPGGATIIRIQAALDALVTGEDPRVEKPVLQAQVLHSAPDVRPIGQWKDAELLEGYGPECNQDIVDELDRRAHGMAFVFFTDETGKNLDVEETLRFLRSARRNIAPPSNYKSGKKVLRLYRAGEFPSSVQELCPLHQSVSLFDSYCDQCKCEWDGIGKEERQFIALLPKWEYEFKKKSEYDQLFELARKGIDALREEYPDVGSEFDSLKEKGRLPVLEVRSSSDGGHRKADPVNVKGTGHRRF